MKYEIKVELEKEDLAVLHDAVYDVVGVDSKEITEPSLITLFKQIPEAIKLDAIKWGMNDTEVRESIHEWIEEKLQSKTKQL